MIFHNGVHSRTDRHIDRDENITYTISAGGNYAYVEHIPPKYAYNSCYVVFCCEKIQVDFTPIVQGCFTGTGAII